MQLRLRFEETAPTVLEAVWDELDDEQRFEVVERLARVMAKASGWGSDDERVGENELEDRGGEADDD